MTDTPKKSDIIRKLYNYDGEDKIITSVEMYENLKSSAKNTKAIMAKISSLDNLIHGFESGELTVISGMTKNGKTLFALTLTRKFIEQEIGCLWFTYEVPPYQFLKLFGENVPTFYMPATLKANSLDWLYDRIWEAKLKYDIHAVFIDHLHFLVDLGKHSNMSLEIGYVMRTLKRIALNLNICIFIISHTQKLKPDTELDLDHIRDSAFTAAEADNVLMIWRNVKRENEATLKIAANRRFGVMGKKIKLVKVGNFLEEANYVEY